MDHIAKETGFLPAQNVKTHIRFLGVDACLPAPGGESTCLLLNDDVLVDAGWNAAHSMRRLGCDPLRIDRVFITHCHHDHYVGLASLLYYHGTAEDGRRRHDPPVVIGPRTEIGIVVRRALLYLQNDRYALLEAPKVVPLAPGDGFETDRFCVKTTQALHPTIGLCYRFEDRRSGGVLVVTGDTAYHAPLGRFAAGADLLVHEAAAGSGTSDPLDPWGHSGAVDAAKIARAARPKRLCLVHCAQETREEALEAARRIFPGTCAPQQGDVLELPLR